MRFKIEDGVLCESRQLLYLRRVVLDDVPSPAAAVSLPENTTRLVLVIQPPERVVVCSAQLGYAIAALWQAKPSLEVLYRSELPAGRSGDTDFAPVDYAEKLLLRLRLRLKGKEDEPLTLASLARAARDTAEQWGHVAGLAVKLLPEAAQTLQSVIEVALIPPILSRGRDEAAAFLRSALTALPAAVPPSSAPANVVPAAFAVVGAIVDNGELVSRGVVARAFTEEFLWWCTEISGSPGQRSARLVTERLLFDAALVGVRTEDIRRVFAGKCAEAASGRKGAASRGQLGIAASDPTEALRAYCIARRAEASAGGGGGSALRVTVAPHDAETSRLVRVAQLEGFVEVLNDEQKVATVVATHRVAGSGHVGKWYFEAVLFTGGSMRIGWVAANAALDGAVGVGGSELSWGFDGSSMALVHNGEQHEFSSSLAGMRWRRGDVVRCEFDVAASTLSFSLNGAAIPMAFDTVPRSVAEKGLRPAVSLSPQQSIALNFGGAPFMFAEPQGALKIEANTEKATKCWSATASPKSPDARLVVIKHVPEAAARAICQSCRTEPADAELACGHHVLCKACSASCRTCPMCSSPTPGPK